MTHRQVPSQTHRQIRRQVLVVGAGPGGLAAADAALAAGADVTLVDSAPQPGGQYHRMLPEAFRARHPGAVQHGWAAFERRRRRVLGHSRCVWLPDTAVWALERPAPGRPSHPPRVHLVRGPVDGAGRPRHVLSPDALVLAPGAYDRMLPFPGWELPGVFTAGAAQALAKGERVTVGDRVVVAGTGPFLLPVASSLLEAGSRVREVLEASTVATLARGWTGRPWELAAAAGKAGELLEHGRTLARHGVPYRIGRTVVEARGAGRVEEVVTAALRPDWSVVPGSERTVTADAVCAGHGFTPQLELPLAAGCDLYEGFVLVDGDQLTSCPGVYAAGEITGIAGAPAARAEGALAGWFAAGGDDGAKALGPLRRARDQGRRFAGRLARAHPVGSAWHRWLRDDTVICRCEGTDHAALRAAASSPPSADPRVGRLTTRAGLGPCQARVCGPTVAGLTAAWRTEPGRGAPCGAPGGRPHDAPRGDAAPAVEGLPAADPHRRPLAQPVRLGDLARAPVPLPSPPGPERPGPSSSPPQKGTS